MQPRLPSKHIKFENQSGSMSPATDANTTPTPSTISRIEAIKINVVGAWLRLNRFNNLEDWFGCIKSDESEERKCPLASMLMQQMFRKMVASVFGMRFFVNLRPGAESTRPG